MEPIQRILLPVDFSTPSMAAMSYGLDLARALGARATLLHVSGLPNYVLPDGTALLANAEAIVKITEAADRELNALIDTAKRHESHVPLDTKLVEGDPAREIVRVAGDEKYDIIVIGTHGRGFLERVLLGSVPIASPGRASCRSANGWRRIPAPERRSRCRGSAQWTSSPRRVSV
jgi:nucleotide-binding universal stress UspA family protein